MARTAIVFTPKYYKHTTGLGHPESPTRLKAIVKELKKTSLLSPSAETELVEPPPAEMEDLELVHSSEHIRLVERICEHGGGLLDLGDTVASPESFEVARYAVGGALRATEMVFQQKARNAFALVRPPGHHAGPYYAMGFCLFNNVAIAAACLTRRLYVDRVAVLDLDAHHGNGTQEIFYHTDKVLYISLHEDPRIFPGTGFVEEIGEGEGAGYTVNIPLPFAVSDESYFRAMDEIVCPILRQYEPQFILASAGYDGYWGDPVGELSLSASAYPLAFERVLNLASQVCGDRFVAVLEGGYDVRRLGKIVASTISKMAGIPGRGEDGSNPRAPNKEAEKMAEEVLKEVKKAQSGFWSLES